MRLNLTAPISAIIILFAFSINMQAYAQSNTQPNELQAIYACKTIADSQKRLACYDSSVGRFEAAEKSGEVVTVSKTAIEKVERDAFGFNIPSLPSLSNIFGGKTTPKEKAVRDNALTAPIKEATKEQTSKAPIKTSTLTIKPEASKVTKVSLDIRKTKEFGYKKTRFFMANGQVWEQVDGQNVRIPKVRNGVSNSATISKASLGSFMLRVNGKGKAIRVRRVR